MRKKAAILLAAIAAAYLAAGCTEEETKDMQKKAEDIVQEAADQVENITDSEDENVLGVKGGHPEAYPDISYGEAFDNFFEAPTWKYFEGEDGEEVVEFTGYCTYQDAEVKARLQFLLNEDGTFTSGALSFNDVPQSQFITAALLEKVFTQYAQENGIQTADGTDGFLDTEDVSGDDGTGDSDMWDEGTEHENTGNKGTEHEDAGDGDAKEGDSSDGDAKEGDSSEGNAKEGDSNEGDASDSGSGDAEVMAAINIYDAAGRYESGTQVISISIFSDYTEDGSVGNMEWSDSATGESETVTLYVFSEYQAVFSLKGRDYRISFTEKSASWYDEENSSYIDFEKTESYQS